MRLISGILAVVMDLSSILLFDIKLALCYLSMVVLAFVRLRISWHFSTSMYFVFRFGEAAVVHLSFTSTVEAHEYWNGTCKHKYDISLKQGMAEIVKLVQKFPVILCR